MSVMDGPFQGSATAAERARGGERTIRRPSTAVLVILGIVIAAVAGVIPLVQNSDATTRGYELRDLERQRDDIRSRTHALEVEVAELASTARVEREARQRLGMSQPERTTILWTNVPGPGAGYIPQQYRVELSGDANEQESRPLWEKLLGGLLN